MMLNDIKASKWWMKRNEEKMKEERENCDIY